MENMNTNESLESAAMWTIEPHGNGYALYLGRGTMRHGMNLVYLSEPDSSWEATKRLIEAAPTMLNALRRIVRHQDLIGGSMASMSSTRHIAAQAIQHATGEAV
jgi:hypothetical protein